MKTAFSPGAGPVSLTVADCDQGAHYFKTGWKGKKPECNHTNEYKKCNNCGHIVWSDCKLCAQRAAVLTKFGITGAKSQRNQNQK